MRNLEGDVSALRELITIGDAHGYGIQRIFGKSENQYKFYNYYDDQNYVDQKIYYKVGKDTEEYLDCI
ncbi:MAG: hypothetical protein EZS28_020695 [Streblomastix strix]|uniref:Uncharacterized protein n=1 Tax=Streblomastix strix TaxID=222440 RepID=A0A5J4VMF8_9EUKA|nr:MAG: hypothetical protein EZS28_020695 [Streblomastix strix]